MRCTCKRKRYVVFWLNKIKQLELMTRSVLFCLLIIYNQIFLVFLNYILDLIGEALVKIQSCAIQDSHYHVYKSLNC